MVISHKYRYVFIQTMKAASTAVAEELCLNYGGQFILKKHDSIVTFRLQASEEEKTYFSFAGVRNPLDVAVSRYLLRKAGVNTSSAHREQSRFVQDNDADFNKFFFTYLVARYPGSVRIALVPNDWQSDDFQSIDYIYRYENLQQEFSTVLNRLGIEQKRELPLSNLTKGKTDYLEYYDEQSLRLAGVLFSDYMNHWGYKSPQIIEDVDAVKKKLLRLVNLRNRLPNRTQHFLDKFILNL